METAAHGSELVAACIAINPVVEMRCELRLLGTSAEERTTVLGDNALVELSTAVPSSRSLKKKHLACSHQGVCQV